jgi:hypothetical protein
MSYDTIDCNYLIIQFLHLSTKILWWLCQSYIQAHPTSISTCTQYVTQDSKIYSEKVKMCRFSSRNSLFLHQICAACCGWWEEKQSCAPPKKSVINWTWLRLSISDWSVILIGPDGLLSVVFTNMQFPVQFYCWQNKTAKLRHLILFSRVTYWAPVEML